MNKDDVQQLVKDRYEALSKQERLAATFILENPNEVAVMSMRDLSRMAGIVPATMTRLAKRLGLDGYEALKTVYVEDMRLRGKPYSGRAQKLVQLSRRIGERALLQDLANDAIGHVNTLCQEGNIDALTRASKMLGKARQIYCLGVRSSFAVAYQFNHVASYFQDNVHLIDGAGDSAIMSLMHRASTRDVAIVCSLPRYARRAINIAGHLHQQGVRIIAITDSPTSPVGRLASETILVRNQTSSFFDTIVPALLATEMLIALLASASKNNFESRVTSAEEKLMGLGEWWEGA